MAPIDLLQFFETLLGLIEDFFFWKKKTLDNLTRVLMNSLLINGRFFQQNIHYGKLCLLKPRYPTTKAQKIIHIQLLCNYPPRNTRN